MGKQAEIREGWRQRVAEQEQSGVSIRAYCKERGLGEHSFYNWRQRLRSQGAVTFALVESKVTSEPSRMVELVLAAGERLRIRCEEGALRLVLQVLRTER